MTLPKPHDDFEWVQAPWGTALRCGPLAALAAHLFTTREPILRLGGAERPEGWANATEALGRPLEALVRLRQVHGADVFVCHTMDAGGAEPAGELRSRPSADAVVTDAVGIVLAVQVADCVPVLIADRRTGAVAAAHAGWRGSAAGVARATVEALAREYGARAADLTAAIGPSIGPCCYQVGAPVRRAFDEGAGQEHAARWFTNSPAWPGTAVSQPGKLWLDLWQANRDQLIEAGLSAARVHIARLCTSCHHRVLWSFRRDGEQAGRMAGLISRPSRR